jgi:Ca2+-binding EF-hand superfamily protein
MTEAELQTTIDTLDMNGNNYIDYTEFLAASMGKKVFLREENLRQAFKYFDKVSS